MPRTRRRKNATPDVPDLRDWIYRPRLQRLPPRLDPPEGLTIMNQHGSSACTGFSLAAAINLQYARMGESLRVSPRMLYEMAKRYDEWPGEHYDGSSLRGAIKGWVNMGVCREALWPFRVGSAGRLTVRRAKDARNHTVGAYYRLQPEVSHYHAALNEAGAVVVTAQVHKGWDEPRDGVIEAGGEPDGGHAFVLVGYDERGFRVQNSWGRGWGEDGLAIWTYEDWIENVWDAWVFRLALPTPRIFGLRPSQAKPVQQERGRVAKVPRSRIAGHFVHVDDGDYVRQGRYWSDPHDVSETARLLAASDKYRHLLIYVHGGLNTSQDSARRIDAMRDVFKANGIYPFHIMYDTGLVEEMVDLVRRKCLEGEGRAGGFSDWIDRLIEGLLRKPGALLWEEMKRDAHRAFAPGGAATDAIERLLKALSEKGRKLGLHLVGHSTGGVALGSLLATLRRRRLVFDSCSLMAPACTLDWYQKNYLPALQQSARLRIQKMDVYNLNERLEKDDNVAGLYHKSLLYLVSNAFEPKRQAALLGMQKFSKGAPRAGGQPRFHYSDGVTGQVTRSTSHGGFDNDPWTMNHILRRVLGKAPGRSFTNQDLTY